MPRNLICLIDGTQVSASTTDRYGSYSNVFELAYLLQLSDETGDHSPQIVFYASGISSQPDNSSYYNLATGNSIMSQIVDQYTNLCSNFDFDAAKKNNPDRIYLFGFSRGAMAIRAIAGLIAEFGLLQPQDIKHMPVLLDAWNKGEGAKGIGKEIRLIGAEIEFVGLFDSVMGGIESLGVFNPVRFSNLQMPGKCKHGVHLLAVDDNRFLFRPKPWEGRQPPRNALGKKAEDRWMRQIWMPGVHADVGGIGDQIWGEAALLAMIFYLRQHTCLALRPDLVREREEHLNKLVDQKRFEIRPHKWSFPGFPRQAGKKEEWFERRHPICDQLSSIKYGKSKRFDWRKLVFGRNFEPMDVDEDLAKYFDQILEVDEGRMDRGTNGETTPT